MVAADMTVGRWILARKKRTEPEAPPPITREAVLRFIAEHPAKATKRDIARAFEVKGEDRVSLKTLLRDLEQEGLIERKQKRLSEPGALPGVLVCEVVSRDDEGDIYAEPVTWDDSRGAPPRLLVVERRQKRGEAGLNPGLGDRILGRIIDIPEGYEAVARAAVRPIKLLERKPAGIMGVFRLTVGGAGRVDPVSKKQQGQEYVVAPEFVGDAEDGDLVTIDVHRTGRYGLAQAKIRERIGSLKSEKAVSMIAIHANDIPYIFPKDVLAEAEAAEPVRLSPPREDWRDLPLVTIDPADAKDHDDAVHALPDPDPANPGGVIATVAIADVAHYVRPGSALDREALSRGNSVYFPDRVIPMLPERISNDLCSLKEAVDRPALAVRMIFDAGGRKLRHSFHRIMMRSAAKLSYQQAQAAIDGRPDDKTAPLLETILKPLWAGYAVLLKGRTEREPLELDLPERKILLKPDGTVDRVVVPERLDAHKLIEELMIQANVAAAETLEAKRSPLVYRVHDQPSMSKLESLREFLATLDLKIAKQGEIRPSEFNRILARVEEAPHAHLVNEVVLRSQSQAEYSPFNIGHFGLNLRRYAHFTSPIRRYADLIVHRALVRALGLGEDGLPSGIEDRLERIAADISAAERRAMLAERETIDRLIAEWLSDRVGAIFRGRIGGVTKAGLFVKLADTGADGFVPAATLGADYYAYDEVRHALVGSRSGETFQLGDTVEVRLVEVAPLAGALRFEMVSSGRAGRPVLAAACAGGAMPRAPATSRRAAGLSPAAAGADRIRPSGADCRIVRTTAPFVLALEVGTDSGPGRNGSAVLQAVFAVSRRSIQRRASKATRFKIRRMSRTGSGRRLRRRDHGRFRIPRRVPIAQVVAVGRGLRRRFGLGGRIRLLLDGIGGHLVHLAAGCARLLDLAPVGDVAVVVLQRLGEDVPARAVRDEVEVLRTRRGRHSFQRRAPGIGDRARRQAVDLVGVVGRPRIDVGAADRPPEGAVAADDAVDDRRVRLQPHVLPQAVDEHGGDARPLVRPSCLLLHDGGERHQFLDGVEGKARPPALPHGLHGPLVGVRHLLQDRLAGGPAGEAVGFRQQRPLRRDLVDLPGQHDVCLQAVDDLLGGQPFRDGDRVHDRLAGDEEVHHLPHARPGRERVFAGLEPAALPIGRDPAHEHVAVGDHAFPLQGVGDRLKAGFGRDQDGPLLGERSRRIELGLAPVEHAADDDDAQHHDRDHRVERHDQRIADRLRARRRRGRLGRDGLPRALGIDPGRRAGLLRPLGAGRRAVVHGPSVKVCGPRGRRTGGRFAPDRSPRRSAGP